MVCRDADEKAKDRPVKRSGGNVAKVYIVLLQELAFLRTGGKREPQEDDARVNGPGPTKRRRAEPAACSVRLNHACPGPCPMIRHASRSSAGTPRSSQHFPCRHRCRYLSGHVSFVAATRMYRMRQNHRVRRSRRDHAMCLLVSCRGQHRLRDSTCMCWWQAHADGAGWSWIAVRMDERAISALVDGLRQRHFEVRLLKADAA